MRIIEFLVEVDEETIAGKSLWSLRFRTPGGDATMFIDGPKEGEASQDHVLYWTKVGLDKFVTEVMGRRRSLADIPKPGGGGQAV